MVRNYRRNLPHWHVEGSTYFVTWCLNSGQPPLSGSERSLVRDALHFADGRDFDLFAYVVMDDHVHPLFEPRPGVLVEKIMHSWRSFTTVAAQAG